MISGGCEEAGPPDTEAGVAGASWAVDKACRMAWITASRTSDGFRKRTSFFAGWTFTSTSDGSISM